MRFSLRTIIALVVVVLAGLALWARPFFTAPDTAAPDALARAPVSPTSVPPTSTPSPPPSPTPTPAATATPKIVIVPYGSVVEDGMVVVVPTPELRVSPQTLVDRYGESVFPSAEAMPEQVRVYFTATVGEIADYFEVRPEDLVFLLEQQNGGLRIARPATAAGEVPGVAQMPPRLWNGWASPERERYAGDVRLIEQYGGLGFDWMARYSWAAWARGRLDGGSPFSVSSDPSSFENGLAALARFLVREGLTRDQAARDPKAFDARLASVAEWLRAESTAASAESVTGPGASAVSFSPPSEVLEHYRALIDESFGVALSDEALIALLDVSAAEMPAGGESGIEAVAQSLFEQVVGRFQSEGRAAREAGRPVPWPFVYDEQTLAAQIAAARTLGHTLPLWEIEALIAETGGAPEAMAEALSERAEAEVFAEARRRFDEGLRRSARGLPVRLSEVSALMAPSLVNRSYSWLSNRDKTEILGEFEHRLRLLPEFRELNGDMIFDATPFSPMPSRILKPFGSAASYQPEGVHTGLDLRGRRVAGRQPLIYAVDDGTVVHVGPLYCDLPDSCRGRHAIVIDHGNNIYTIYSHNSEASVTPGERVTAGQPIGRQGDEGYSRGPHLHLEVHVGAPYSGDWRQPFYAGEFVDPYPWLPQEDDLAAVGRP